jgi:hypothetical protein
VPAGGQEVDSAELESRSPRNPPLRPELRTSRGIFTRPGPEAAFIEEVNYPRMAVATRQVRRRPGVGCCAEGVGVEEVGHSISVSRNISALMEPIQCRAVDAERLGEVDDGLAIVHTLQSFPTLVRR